MLLCKRKDQTEFVDSIVAKKKKNPIFNHTFHYEILQYKIQ